MRVAKSVKVESKLRLNGKHSGLRVGVARALQSSSTLTALFPCCVCVGDALQKMTKKVETKG